MRKTLSVALAILAASLLMVSPDAQAAHPKPGETGYRGIQFNPAMAGIPLLDYFSMSPIRPYGPAVDGRYKGLAPFGIRASCNLCHFDIVANENKNRHATMSYNKIVLPEYGYGYDKEKPWVSGPGKFGRWSPVYNRQLGNMNTTYATEADLVKKLDLGAFEFTTECGVCHVGGGPGITNPYGFTFSWRVSSYFGKDLGAGGVHSNLDNEFRNQSIANDFIFPLPLSSPYYPRRVPLNPWDFFVANDTVQQVDWAQWGSNGTLQLDCLMCHLQGYDHLARNEEITRYQRLYNAGTVGSGLAVLDAAAGDGFSMDYDASQVMVASDGNLYLDFSFTDRITRFPQAGNCVHCHMPTAVKNQAGVDWKKQFYAYDAVPSDDPANPGNVKPARYLSDMVKRGDIWNSDELHKGLQCSGCHSQTGKFQAWKSNDANYMHSPGKGYDPMGEGADEFGGTVKFCYDCHVLKGDVNGDGVTDTDWFYAPVPDNSHSKAGLMAKIVPGAKRLDDKGAEVQFTGSHLDIISCTSCHIQKRYAAARSIDYSTGAQFFNFVGNALDQSSGPERVDLAYSWKETVPKLRADGTPNPLWRRLIYPFNYVTGIYWNNVGSKDANGDGFTTGMSNNGKIVAADPFFQRAVKENFRFGVNQENNRIPTGLTGNTGFDSQSVKNADGAVMFTRPAEIEAYRSQVTTKDPGLVPQLVLESEPYLITHNVLSTGQFALGKTATGSNGVTIYGCSDCHGGTGGVYNGSINMIGKAKAPDSSTIPVTVRWNSNGQVAAKAVSWDRDGIRRSISFADTVAKSTRDISRSEFLGYDASRVAALNAIDPAAYGLGLPPVPAINAIADADSTQFGTQVVIGLPVALSCPPAQFLDANKNGKYDAGETLVGQVSYAWGSSDSGAVITGGNSQNASIVFGSTGAKTITLTVTDEEGITRTTSTSVTAIVPPISISWEPVSDTATFTSFPAGTAYMKIYWGDGLISTVTTNTPSVSVVHHYSTGTAKQIKVYCYNSGGGQLGYATKIITP
ncbi:hypothetical protein KP004_14475 [Geomonas oryzisoli]|uniref:PKD domain-containing protein n=1 Tax=Geomonas oryzisoli TaxID=2847992 RepID=A0ABX8J241_9BACT|nr:hypothetical protein [Geomonas oryzisoli]QWV92404.1 hypothetical protein KP004_14475 [Geomonas oryzisoli]